jgi:hypothetical protein
MQEIAPGIFHWSTFHEPIGSPVSSYYIPSAGVVLDPKQPEGGWSELPGMPEQVLLSSGHHNRDAQAFADEFGIPIRASRQAAELLGDTLTVDEPFDDGDQPAPGITAINIGTLSDDEGALHIAVGEGAIAFADGLTRPNGKLGFVPDQLIGDDPEAVKRELRQAFTGLLDRDFDILLFAHGEPLVGGGKAALREFAQS